MPGLMNKANARQHSHNAKKYEEQKFRTERNKARNIKKRNTPKDKKAD